MERVDVVVVDDNDDICRLYHRFLTRQGYTVECFSSGRPALEFLLHARVGLVILDFMMPELDGIEVLRRIRQTPQTANVAVVMNSAIVDEKMSDYAIACGANEFV